MPKSRKFNIDPDVYHEDTESQRSHNGLTQTQSSQSLSTRIDSEEQKRLAKLIANFFLTAQIKKIPVKRPDLLKVVPKEHSRLLNELIKQASDILEKTYSFKVEELTKKGTYIMVNLLEVAEEGNHQSKKTLAVIGLRTSILTLIYMNGGNVNEGTLKLFLEKLLINFDVPHDVFGNIPGLFQEFSKQGYLEINVDKDVEPHTKIYKWGERSHKEINKGELLNHLCRMYGDDVTAEMWMEQC